MLFVGTSIIHPSTEGVFLLCNILDLLIYSFEIEITDSGIGMSEKQLAILRRKLRMRLNSDTQPKHGIGLRNVQDRIHIQFGTEYGLSVYTKEHCYTKVSIHLPITRGKYSPMDQEGDEKEEEKENEYTAGCRR